MSTTSPISAEFSWEESLPYTLWRTQNAVHRFVQSEVEDLGVTVTQLGLAVHLHKLGPLSASDMSRGFRITPQSVATALARLDRIGWVRRQPHPVHGRVVLYTMTDVGLRGVNEGTKRMAGVTARVAGIVSDSDAEEAVVSELRRILHALEGSSRPMELLWPVQGR
ncbi:MarR family winged helix-turn-helix transcriptional regulator [Agromyces sp. Soil535]|uniref:MarR family winged helix-turn-helix transcriptional regulator n=1 Tax=Agromyces sp. Soil535 TaxID=1736390 RepID=UPI0006F9A9ED|nr:MarR family transcriptional regulator [Agromyces sp. Soil535]KRE23314.1 hypothetical protein ASG80_06200 [Agromyces sp. Soil535]